MIISKRMKEIIVTEIKYSISKMDEAASTEEKLYYFSAVHGTLNRAFNIEFSPELLFAYFIFNETLNAFQQKLAAMKMGDTVFGIDSQQMDRLTDLTRQYIAQFEEDKGVDIILKKMVALRYSCTGNGNYLRGKGLLKI